MEIFFNRVINTALFTCVIIWAMTSDSLKPILIITAIFIHEVGHLLIAFVLKNRFKRLSTQQSGLKLSGNLPYSSYATESITALGGPLFNFISAGICLALSSSENMAFFSTTSFALGVLNLLPIKDFDGGRITECIISLFFPYYHATAICDILSFLSLFFLWSMAVYLMIRSSGSVTLFMFSVSLFAKIFLKSH